MKKMIIVLSLALLAGYCYARTSLREVLSDEQMSTANTYTTVDVSVESAKRVAFFINCDSSLTTEGVTVQVSPQFSIDGETWVEGKFFDIAGGSTLQTSQDMSFANSDGELSVGDGGYYMWFDDAMPLKYIRLGFGLDGTAAGQLGTAEYNSVTVTLIEDK